jgi:hypothetical protein
MPRDQHIEDGHGEGEPRLKIRPHAGGVSNELISASDRSSRGQALDAEAHHQSLSLESWSNTAGLARAAVPPCTPRGVLTCDLVRRLFAHWRRVRSERTTRGPPPRWVTAREAPRRPAGWACPAAGRLSPPQDRGPGRSRAVSQRLPPPPLLAGAAHQPPPCLPLGGLPLGDDALPLRSLKPRAPSSKVGGRGYRYPE